MAEKTLTISVMTAGNLRLREVRQLPAMKTPALSSAARFTIWFFILLCVLPRAIALDPPPAALLSTDTDGDGQPDVAEWFTGTNPNLRTDVVRLNSIVPLTNPPRMQLSWSSVSGRVYSIEKSTSTAGWQQVSSVTASAAQSTVAVPYSTADRKVFYRVTTSYDIGRAPFINSFTADRTSPLNVAASVRFKLRAYHPSGIAAVQIFDGAAPLGNAVQAGQSEWVFDWLTDERNNGAHSFKARMTSVPGVTLDSVVLPFTVNISGVRARRPVTENLELSATAITQNGTTVTATGNVRIGPFTVAGTAAVTWNTVTQIITGTGPLLGPGGATIFSVPWTIDAASGIASVVAGTTGLPSPMTLIPGFLVLTPTSWYDQPIPITAGTLSGMTGGGGGTGTLTGSFPGRNPVNSINASGSWFTAIYVSYTLKFKCSQAVTFGSGVSAEKESTINLLGINPYPPASGSFPQPQASVVPMLVTGRLHFPAGSGGAATDIDGMMEVKLPVTALDPSLAPLVQGVRVGTVVPVIGSVDPDGSFRPVTLPTQPDYLLEHPGNFVPLGPDGEPIEGGRVIADILGNLPAVEWRPVIPCANGGRGTFALRFPNGLQIVKNGALSVLKFLHMKLASAPDCPLQLGQDYEIHSSTTLSLDMDGAVTVADLLGVFSLNASAGIHFSLFGRFDAVLKSGTFSPKGLVGAVLDMAGGILDWLPDPGFGFPDVIFDYQCPQKLKIPCRWPVSLPGGGTTINFAGGEGTLECDPFELCVNGSARVTLGSGGPFFEAALTGCGDEICMEVFAEDLDFSFSSSWTLPGAETIDAATAATRTALDPIAKALRHKLNACERRAVAFRRWLDQITPPGPVLERNDTLLRQGKAMLESFANAKIAVPSLPAPAELTNYLQQAGRAARTAPTFDALLEVWMTLEQLKASGLPVAAGTPLQTARLESWDEISDRLDAGIEISIGTATRAVQFYIQRRTLLTGQTEDDAGLATRTGRIIDRAASLTATDLSVSAGVVDLIQNPTVRSLSLEEAWTYLQTLYDLFAGASANGIPVSASARKSELLTLLAKHCEALLARAIPEIASRFDRIAHGNAVARYVWIARRVTDGTIQGVVVSIVVPVLITSHIAIMSVESGIGAVSAIDVIVGALADISFTRTLLSITKEAGSAVSVISAAVVTVYYNAARASLDAAWASLSLFNSEEIRVLLEAGIQNAKLRDYLGLGDGTIGWESAQRMGALVDRLVTLSASQNDPAMLETLYVAATMLLDEAARFDGLTVPNQTKRKFCLLEAEKLAFRLLALANTLRTRATAATTLTWTGGIQIEQAAAGICYNHATGVLTGRASGVLNIPGFGTTFTVKSAQISTNGDASIVAEATSLPGFPALSGALTFTGTITRQGVWSFTATAAAGLPKPTGLPWDVSIQAGATVTVNNQGITVGVNSTTGGVAAAGTLNVTTAGVATFSGSLSLNPITVGVMSLRGNGPGDKLVLSLSGAGNATVSGARFTAGAPFNQTVNLAPFSIGPNLVFPALPVAMLPMTFGPFSVGVTWNWSVQVSTAPSIAITTSATVVGSMSGVITGTGTIPLGSGTIATNGAFTLTGQLTASLPKPPALAWDVSMPAGTSYTLTPNRAIFTVTAGSGLVTATGTVEATWSGTPLTAAVTFDGTLFLDTSVLTSGILTVIPSAAGATKLSLSISGGASASLTGAKLRLAGPFANFEIPLPELLLNTAYNFTAVTPAPLSVPLRGYSLNSFQCSVQRSGGNLSVTNISCQLPAPPGLPAISLTGSISSDGSFNLGSGTTTPSVFGYSATGSFTFSSPSALAYAFRLSALSPEASWTLDDTAGSATLDSTAHGHNGTRTGTVQVNQPGAGYPATGTSYLFNGTNGYAAIPHAATLEGGTAMTVMAWIKVNTFTQDWQTVVGKGANAWHLIRYANTNRISFDTRSAGANHSLPSDISVADGNWHHIAGVYDNGTKSLYVDGRLEKTGTTAAGPLASNNLPVWIGALQNPDGTASGQYWSGGVDDVAFFRRGLSGEEVRSLYAAGNGATLAFSGTLPVPGFPTASIPLSGTLAYDNALSFTGTLPELAAGSFALTAAGGGSLALTLSSTGLAVPASRLALGSLFLPVNLPAFTIPAGGGYSVPFTPPSLNLRGFQFPSPNLTFLRSGGNTTLNIAAGAPSLPGLPAIPFTGSISSSGAVAFTSSAPQTFFGFGLAGGFSLGAPPQNFGTRMTALGAEAWWALNEEDIGDPVEDYTGHGHHGTPLGSPTVNEPGPLYPATRQSYRLDGVNDVINIPHHPNLQGGTAMTIMAWIKVDAFTQDWQTVVGKGANAWHLIRYANTNSISFDTRRAGANDSLPSANSVADGQWHHVTGVYDNGTKSLYVDGRLENTRVIGTGPLDNNSLPVWIGALQSPDGTASGQYWNGGIDEVAFFQRALSAAEIRELHAAGNGLRLFFNGNATLPGLTPATDLTLGMNGVITSGAGFDFSTSAASGVSLFGYGFNNAGFSFRRDENLTATFTGSLALNTIPTIPTTPPLPAGFAPLSGNPVCKAVFTVEPVQPSGVRTRARLTVDDLHLNLCGYVPAGNGFDLSLDGILGATTPPLMNFSDFSFNISPGIGNLGLPALGGTITPAGVMKVTRVGASLIATGSFLNNLNLRNLPAPNASITFDQNGLNVVADVNFIVTANLGGTLHPRDLGDARFTGRIQPDGSFDLAGNGTVTLGGFVTNSFPMRFRSAGPGRSIQPAPGVTPILNIGSLPLPIELFEFDHDWLSYSLTKSGDFVNTHLPNPANGQQPLLRTTFHYDLFWYYDFATNVLSGNMSANAWWKWEVINFVPPPGFPASDTFNISPRVVAPGGAFTVDNATADGTHFMAPFWPGPTFLFAPPPLWPLGVPSWTSESYTLW